VTDGRRFSLISVGRAKRQRLSEHDSDASTAGSEVRHAGSPPRQRLHHVAAGARLQRRQRDRRRRVSTTIPGNRQRQRVHSAPAHRQLCPARERPVERPLSLPGQVRVR